MNKSLVHAVLTGICYDHPYAGVSTSTDDETREDWANREFGITTTYEGAFRNDGLFVYQYDEPLPFVSEEYLSGIAHVSNEGGLECKVYIYLIN